LLLFESKRLEEARMATKFRKGDRVRWRTPQGETVGRVEKLLTEETYIERHKVAASEDNPEYLVRSEKSGKLAAHRPEALRRAKD